LPFVEFIATIVSIVNFIRANERVKIKITDFDGPLDLLLHLIREQKLDIKTVRLAQVTSQYLEYMNDIETLDLDLASEFIEVGATLIEIKARNILPKESTEEESPEDAEQRLLAQLEEYKLLKEASEKLKILENVDRYYKEPVKLKVEYQYVLDNLNMDELIQAFTKVLFKVERNAVPVRETQIRMDRFTVSDKIREVRGLLLHCERVVFSDLFLMDFTRGEVINTFLALLELLKHQEIKVKQEQQFGDIVLIRGEAYQEDYKEPIVAEFDGLTDEKVIETVMVDLNIVGDTVEMVVEEKIEA